LASGSKEKGKPITGIPQEREKKAYVGIGKVMCKLGLTGSSSNAARGVGLWLSSEKHCHKQSIDAPAQSASKGSSVLNG